MATKTWVGNQGYQTSAQVSTIVNNAINAKIGQDSGGIYIDI